ncbi:hypothetical protein O1L55_09405 [Streptomyces albulus]|nr:hypothetical protein [Streptomyces noursei]
MNEASPRRSSPSTPATENRGSSTVLAPTAVTPRKHTTWLIA